MEGPPMKPTLMLIDVFEWYSKAEERLCKDLKQMSMEDHDCSLRSWDQGGARVIKFYCNECQNIFDGSTGKHIKFYVTNLFSKFEKKNPPE